MTTPLHGTPEGYDHGCQRIEACPAFEVHGLSCETAHIRFVTGERRYLTLRGKGLKPSEIAARLGFIPGVGAAGALPATNQPAPRTAPEPKVLPGFSVSPRERAETSTEQPAETSTEAAQVDTDAAATELSPLRASIRELHDLGLSPTEIAREVDRSSTTVVYHLQKLGLKPHDGRRKNSTEEPAIANTEPLSDTAVIPEQPAPANEFTDILDAARARAQAPDSSITTELLHAEIERLTLENTAAHAALELALRSWARAREQRDTVIDASIDIALQAALRHSDDATKLAQLRNQYDKLRARLDLVEASMTPRRARRLKKATGQ